ncbi:MAG TPA: hypothetical protein VGK06_16520 [Methanosarcina sp.]
MGTHSKTRALSLLVLIMFLLVPVAGAVSNTSPAPKNCTSEDKLFKKLSADAELYNKKFDKVPSIIKKLIDSHSALVKITLDNGKVLSIAITTKDGKIETFSKYNPKSNFEPFVTIVTDEKTVKKLIDSKNPFKEAFKSWETGCVTIDSDSCYVKAFLETAQCTLENYFKC